MIYKIWLHQRALQWCNIGIMEPRITETRLYVPLLLQSSNKETPKLHLLALCDGSPPVADGSPHKEPVKQHVFRCYGVHRRVKRLSLGDISLAEHIEYCIEH